MKKKILAGLLTGTIVWQSVLGALVQITAFNRQMITAPFPAILLIP